MNTQELFGQLIPIPPKITENLHRLATHLEPSQSEAITARALAVWVVHRYLKRFDYKSDFCASSAWNFAAQVLTDLADLEIFEDSRSLGIVECIPLPATAESLEIPEQAVMGDRIAYIAVEMNAEKTWGKIIGFTPALETEYPELSIDREDLLECDRLWDLLELAEPLADASRFEDLKSYWSVWGEWSDEQCQVIIAQLERALLLETQEPLQVESAAQELEALIAQSVADSGRELAFREDAEEETRQQLRSILRRLFESLRERED
ncbi:DUF1822 family protein [Laspinema sp. D1]|uniref:DUF1822 family protein n=1 Tax=Laspinema palackyanum TaxID=3231601 RepID=UPI00347C4CA3|nr:DUF1822 family protein [Laspinema sp. D2b]